MLYGTLRLVTGIALRWYYREVVLVGGDRIPPKAPILLAVNHPNALVDALVVGWVVPRHVRITAKAVLFDNPLLGAFLRAVGIVPLRRASDERARREAQPAGAAMPDPARNAESFRAILDALDGGSAVLIFPEGKSHDAPTLEPLKTGPARIALAAREAGRAPGLQVVPVALVFEAKDALRSRVVASVGAPIDVHAWTPPAGSRQPVEALTHEIELGLRDVMLEAPSDAALAEVQQLAAYVTAVLADDAPDVGRGQSLGDEYVVASRIARGLQSLERMPAGVRQSADEVRARTAAFIDRLEKAGIAPEDATISTRVTHGARFAVREVAMLALAGPVALWGRINHWVPFRLARRIALREVSSRDQPAMRTIVAGLAFVLTAYIVQTALVWSLAGGWVALAYLVTLPVAADVDLRYSGRLASALRRMRTYRLLRNDAPLADSLAEERRALAESLRTLDAALSAAERDAAS